MPDAAQTMLSKLAVAHGYVKTCLCMLKNASWHPAEAQFDFMLYKPFDTCQCAACLVAYCLCLWKWTSTVSPETVVESVLLMLQFQALPAQMTWTQAEDELLAAGLLRYGQDWQRISLHVMPVKTIAEMRARQKNRCHRVEGNCIRVSTPSPYTVLDKWVHCSGL